MSNGKKMKVDITFIYFVTFIATLIVNLYLVAEAPLRWYNYFVSSLFLMAKICFDFSKTKVRYALWINLITFLVSVYVYAVMVGKINNYYVNTLATALYLPNCLPYAPFLSFFSDSKSTYLKSIVVVHFLFLLISIVLFIMQKGTERSKSTYENN